MPHPSLLRLALLALLCLVGSSETISSALAHSGRLEQQPFYPPQLEVRSLQAKAEQNEGSSHETKENEPAVEEKEVGNAEAVVSPEFTIHTLSHNHSEVDDAAGDVFNDYINLAFTELSAFVPLEPTPIPSITSPDPIQKAEPQLKQSQSDEISIPNLSDLRNINIDELPQTFP